MSPSTGPAAIAVLLGPDPVPPPPPAGAGPRPPRTGVGAAWGPFKITRKGARGWQASCPFHAASSKTTCKKLFTAKTTAEADMEATVLLAKCWCVAAMQFDRKWKHGQFVPALAEVPPVEVIEAQCPAAPASKCVPDDVLDVAGA
eukprot:15127944-Alexandrium_andersonii.AAC.1